MIHDFLRQYVGDTLLQVLSVVLALYPIWLPIILCVIFWHVWVRYVRAQFFAKTKYAVLEIKLPQEITKSPAAMEVVINSLWELAGETTFFDKYWDGKTRPWYSLEIASIEGDVKFFIWTRDTIKDYIEARLYSQYPGIEIYTVPDYTKFVKYTPGETEMWGCNFGLSKPDVYPIRSYIDYGLDKDPKEEFKIDPLTPVLEHMGSLGPGEQAWIQIIIRAHKKERIKRGKGLSFEWDPEEHFLGFGISFDPSKKVDWTHEAKEEIKEIIESGLMKPPELPDDALSLINLTGGQADVVKAIERNVSKPAFDVGMRGVYIGTKKAFKKNNITGLSGAFRQYSLLNGLKPTNMTKVDYPWQDFLGSGLNFMKQSMLQAYKKRGFFFIPFSEGTTVMVMNAESLASLFHLPGSVAATPTLNRIPSKKAQPPANLPV